MKMGSFSKQEGRLSIGPLGKLGRFKSAAENFLVTLLQSNQLREWTDLKSKVVFR
jgi:hypothetical protein